jgi:hypothetical protein
VKRVFLVLAIALLMAAMMMASALPALAAPKKAAGCNGLANAIDKQLTNRGTVNPVLQAKYDERCLTTTPPTTTA